MKTSPGKKSRVAIIGSGISAISFYYSLRRTRPTGVIVYLIPGEELGIENNIGSIHGHQQATNFVGLGGTAKIWGGIAKPYAREILKCNPSELRAIQYALEALGVSYGMDQWRLETSYSATQHDTFEKEYFAVSSNLQDFWSVRAHALTNEGELIILKNTGCSSIDKVRDKWSIALSGVNSGDTLSDIDYVFVAAGIFHTPKLIEASAFESLYELQAPLDHRMGVIGNIKTKQSFNWKNVLPSSQTHKYAFTGTFKSHSFTIYLQPRLPATISGSRGQDRAIAISILKRPLESILRLRIIEILHPANLLNAASLIRAYFKGATSLDVLYISEEKRTDDGQVASILTDPNLFLSFQHYLRECLSDIGEYSAHNYSEAASEMRSAIHRTSSVKPKLSEIPEKWDIPVIIDASTLNRTSSFNPSLEISISASHTAIEFSEFIGGAQSNE